MAKELSVQGVLVALGPFLTSCSAWQGTSPVCRSLCALAQCPPSFWPGGVSLPASHTLCSLNGPGLLRDSVCMCAAFGGCYDTDRRCSHRTLVSCDRCHVAAHIVPPWASSPFTKVPVAGACCCCCCCYCIAPKFPPLNFADLTSRGALES